MKNVISIVIFAVVMSLGIDAQPVSSSSTSVSNGDGTTFTSTDNNGMVTSNYSNDGGNLYNYSSTSTSSGSGNDNNSLSCTMSNGQENCSVEVNGQQFTGLTRAEAEAKINDQ